MKLFKRGGGLLSGLVFGLMVNIGSAQSAVIYDWTGTCAGARVTDCTGTATAVLTLADTYTPGTAVALSDLITFSFSSSTLSYNIPGDSTFLSVSGTLPSGVSNSVSFFLDFPGNDTHFRTLIGSWNSDEVAGAFVFGLAYQWSPRVSAVPLPAPFLLLSIALGALGLGGWLRKRRALTA